MRAFCDAVIWQFGCASRDLAAQFDITFPALPCEWLSLDAMDISGEMHLDVVRKHVLVL